MNTSWHSQSVITDKTSTMMATNHNSREDMASGNQTSTTSSLNGQVTTNKLRRTNSGHMRDMRSQFMKHTLRVQMTTPQQTQWTLDMLNTTMIRVHITSPMNS